MTVYIDLDKAVREMAVRDGVKDSSELQRIVGVRRYDQYAAQIRSYYAGYDAGYMAGVAEYESVAQRRWRLARAWLFGGLVGGALGALLARLWG